MVPSCIDDGIEGWTRNLAEMLVDDVDEMCSFDGRSETVADGSGCGNCSCYSYDQHTIY